MYICIDFAGVAQSVAHLIGSEEVTGSIPVASLRCFWAEKGEVMGNSKEATAKRKSPIKKRLLVPIVLVIVILSAIIVSMMAIIFYNRYQDHLTENRVAENKLIGENVSAFISKAYTLSEELANNPDIKSIYDFKYEDFTLEGYDPHPLIKGVVAV